MIPAEKMDLIYNASLVGMTLSDSFVYAGLTEDEIYEATTSPYYTSLFSKYSRELEFHLLNNVKRIADDRDLSANTWMLEHLYPRYSQKGVIEGKDIRILTNFSDPKKEDTVEVHE